MSDVWIIVSVFFIFLSLLELAVIGFIVKDDGGGPNKRKEKDEREKERMIRNESVRVLIICYISTTLVPCH